MFLLQGCDFLERGDDKRNHRFDQANGHTDVANDYGNLRLNRSDVDRIKIHDRVL